MPHGRMPLPSFWKMVEDTLQQSGAQLCTLCQTFETVAPSPVTQVGAGKGVSQSSWTVASQCRTSPWGGGWLRKWHGGVATATVFPPSPQQQLAGNNQG